MKEILKASNNFTVKAVVLILAVVLIGFSSTIDDKLKNIFSSKNQTSNQEKYPFKNYAVYPFKNGSFYQIDSNTNTATKVSTIPTGYKMMSGDLGIDFGTSTQTAILEKDNTLYKYDVQTSKTDKIAAVPTALLKNPKDFGLDTSYVDPFAVNPSVTQRGEFLLTVFNWKESENKSDGMQTLISQVYTFNENSTELKLVQENKDGLSDLSGDCFMYDSVGAKLNSWSCPWSGWSQVGPLMSKDLNTFAVSNKYGELKEFGLDFHYDNTPTLVTYGYQQFAVSQRVGRSRLVKVYVPVIVDGKSNLEQYNVNVEESVVSLSNNTSSFSSVTYMKSDEDKYLIITDTKGKAVIGKMESVDGSSTQFKVTSGKLMDENAYVYPLFVQNGKMYYSKYGQNTNTKVGLNYINLSDLSKGFVEFK